MQENQTERQALNAAIKRATRRKTRKESTALPSPEMPDRGASNAIFWLCVWMRSQCLAEALCEFHDKAFMRAGAPSRAMCKSDRLMREDANKSLVHLIENGGLLFAWHGTTALAGVEVQR